MRILLSMAVVILIALLILRSQPVEHTTFQDEQISIDPYNAPLGTILETTPNGDCQDFIDYWHPACNNRLTKIL
jgi:hypothetical protein